MSLKFTVVDAFTDKPFSGNPAAVVVLPPDPVYLDVTLQGIAAEMNLSETAFIIQPPRVGKSDAEYQPPGEDFVSYGLRWFTPAQEWRGVCGHATICSASVLFADETRIPANIHEIRFSTLSGMLKARRIVSENAPPRYELEFPAGNITSLADAAVNLVHETVVKATLPDVKVKFAGVCSSKAPYSAYLLVEIESEIPLKEMKVDSGILGTLAPQHIVTVVCQKSKDETADFDYRTFATPAGLTEDPVCGSATSFAAKYWAERLVEMGNRKATNSGEPKDEVIRIRSASRRGGMVELIWDESIQKAKIRGSTRVASRGEVYV
ncbi:hypothetical protein M408DRAFT_326985 [Serendipita vermifera MAFF 305830]|uniref:Diaminopimelate epimerase-like protein n=1 Tax=Serendipita vermifera MAFF 305830 TaxID=933852 RepID=A0A0C2XU38_SERVB|nr:hypothetical protein M408DRAFT_326985 [Serendipita vermifera MAFF 305830]